MIYLSYIQTQSIMGSCDSIEVSVPAPSSLNANSISSAPEPQSKVPISQEAQVLKKNMLANFSIGKELLGMLNGVCFSESQAKDLVKSLINAIIMLEQPQPYEDKETAKALFNQQNIQLVKQGKLLYYGMLEKVKSAQMKQSLKSRIYHRVANLRKQKRIEQEFQNRYEITCIKSNDYKELSQSQIQQIVRYETIAQKAKLIGQKIGFKFQSIKRQSQKMVDLLSICMKKHIETINQLKYDLSDNEVTKMADISRQACNYYDNGAFILLVYFVESCKRLQSQSKSPEEIQILLKKAIEDVYKRYPPGEGLSDQHQELIKTLRELQSPKNYTKVDFIHQQIKLTSTHKQLQIEEIITKYAKIAEESKQLLQELIKATCLAKCVYFKLGLKYNPSKPNIKALTRIKEKMCFQKDQSIEKSICGVIIKEVLQTEQISYRGIIDQILKNSDSVQFKVTDMVRAKCVFLEIADIIYSVNEIKKFVAKNSQYGIASIESRFGKQIPISDVTLKIVLNNKIVAELQLTIQTNAAAYSFAHKIYELQRSKLLTKLKIVHNYFQESREDFNFIAKKTLQLQSTRSNLSSSTSKGIKEFFKLEANSKSFTAILQEVMQVYEGQLKMVNSIDPLLQDLMSIAFNISIGKWGKEVGRTIDRVLKNQHLSPKLKSTMLSVLFDTIHLPKESQNMQQLSFILQDLNQKEFLLEYMREYFGLQKFLPYIRQSQRLYCRAHQLKQIIFKRSKDSTPRVDLINIKFIQNLVIEQNSLQKIDKLQEIVNFYFITRNQGNYIYEIFSDYLRWIEKQLENIKNSQAQVFKAETLIVKSKYLIERNLFSTAVSHLKESLTIFKSREDHSKAMDCQILLAECYINMNKLPLQEYISYYEKNVIRKARILGLKLKGVLYADSLWRISKQLSLNRTKNDDQRKQLLKSFTSKAISQMSRSKGKQFIEALVQKWDQYEINNIQTPEIKENNTIKYAKLRNIFNKFCKYVIKAKWNNITKLDLNYSNISDEGCQILSKADWKFLTALNLSSNSITQKGLQYLSKADWKYLSVLNLQSNTCEDKGCEYLSKANWKNITSLNLVYNRIGDVGCEWLGKADWKNMTQLDLKNNCIQDVGCEHLSKADWSNLTTLSLDKNNFGVKGCEYLSKANWTMLIKLSLFGNRLGDAGCQFISQANWKNIVILDLSMCSIGGLGCQYLSQADWKNIDSLNLSYNNFGPLGCQHLSKANWNKITNINLQQCNIKDGGCEHLSKANWTDIATLDLPNNSIGDQGCLSLSQGRWTNIDSLDLSKNSISDVGCQHLSKARWSILRRLFLRENNITKKEFVEKLFNRERLSLHL